jgi:hypothetical protein
MLSDGSRMRAAVLGNCQALGFADALSAFLPRAEVEVIRLTTLGSDAETVARSEEIAARLRDFTHVFAHPMENARFGPLAADRIMQAEPRVVLVPIIVFTGFHPDCVYLRAGGRKLVGRWANTTPPSRRRPSRSAWTRRRRRGCSTSSSCAG